MPNRHPLTKKRVFGISSTLMLTWSDLNDWLTFSACVTACWNQYCSEKYFLYSWEGLSMQLYTFTVLFTNWNKAAPHDHLKFHNATHKCIGVGWSHLECIIVCDIAEYFTHTNQKRGETFKQGCSSSLLPTAVDQVRHVDTGWNHTEEQASYKT